MAIQDQIKLARDHGISDDIIVDNLSKLPEYSDKISRAKSHNLGSAIIVDSINKSQSQPVNSSPITPDIAKEDPSYASRVGENLKTEAKGFGAGAVSVAGLPMDTVLNIADLAKAGIGYTQSKITGQAPSDWTAPFDRSKIPLTSESLMPNALKPTENDNPYLYAGGAGVSAGLLTRKIPGANLSLSQAAGYGGLSGVSSQAGRDVGQAVGGDTGGNVGAIVGGLAVPMAASKVGGIGGANDIGAAVSEKIKAPINQYNEKQANTISRLSQGSPEKDLAKVMLDENGKKVSDPLAIEAIKQGYAPSLVSSLKVKNPETQAAALKMVDISETGANNRDYRIDNRPSDVVGDALSQKLEYVRKAKEDAGVELDKIASDLKGKPVNTEPAVNDFIADLAKNGVKLDENNNPIYRGSKFEGDKASQKIMDIIIRRAKEASITDAEGAHFLKGFIDQNTNYGVSKPGLTGAAERIVKKFRAGIDNVLDTTFDDYNQANTKYADTIENLNAFQKAAGSSVDIFGENADKALGTKARNLMANTNQRANMMTALDGIDRVASKYGGEFPVSVKTLADFANELDRIHGPHADTSFMSEVSKGTAQGMKKDYTDLSKTTLLGGALTAGAKTIDYLNRVTPETQYKAMKELLKRNANKQYVSSISKLNEGKQ